MFAAWCCRVRVPRRPGAARSGARAHTRPLRPAEGAARARAAARRRRGRAEGCAALSSLQLEEGGGWKPAQPLPARAAPALASLSSRVARALRAPVGVLHGGGQRRDRVARTRAPRLLRALLPGGCRTAVAKRRGRGDEQQLLALGGPGAGTRGGFAPHRLPFSSRHPPAPPSPPRTRVTSWCVAFAELRGRRRHVAQPLAGCRVPTAGFLPLTRPHLADRSQHQPRARAPRRRLLPLLRRRHRGALASALRNARDVRRRLRRRCCRRHGRAQ